MVDKNVVSGPRVDLSGKAEILTPSKEVFEPGDFGATIELIVREGIFDPEGKIVQRVGPKRSESFTLQFMDLLWMMFESTVIAIPKPIRSTSNILMYLGHTAYAFACNAAGGSVLSGIIVGTGITAPVITNYVMETPIAHGVAAGQLQYSAVTFGNPAADATTTQFTITRNFANGSGGAITVKEIGLYVTSGRGSGGTLNYFMTIRDVIAGGINVLNGQTLTVNYRPQVVV